MYRNGGKRIFDFCCSLILILALSPLFLVLVLMTSVLMCGKPFFAQQRPGKNEKMFRLLKFRTMMIKKDALGKLLPDDLRLTRYGRFLRKTSLDELPELFNILKGDMSFVGPRPLLSEYLPFYTQEERKRHSVRPGLTGLAQVEGRNSLTWEEKFGYDLEYIRSISFRTDLKILLRTVRKVIKREDIRVGKEHIVGRLDKERAVVGQPIEER